MPASKSQNEELEVIKTGTCPSLSGKSKLTFEVGRNSTSAVFLRVSKNSGTGYFSQEWVPWDRVQQLIGKNGGKDITCHTLSSLFAGRSVNTSGFLVAVLKHEGLVQPMVDKARCYERVTDRTTISPQGQAPAPTAKKKRR